MTISKREKYFTIGLLGACAVFVVDRVALDPYLDRRDALTLQRQNMHSSLDEAHKTLLDERRLRKKLAGVEGFFKLDPSDAEGRLLGMLQESEQGSGVNGASFQRVGIVEEHGFTRLTYQATALGKMPAIAMFLYRIETASIPVRVDDVQISPKDEKGEDRQVHFSVSTLCRGRETRPRGEAAGNVALLDNGGRR